MSFLFLTFNQDDPSCPPRTMSAASPSDPTLKRDRSPSLDASNEELTAVHPSTSSKKLKSSSPVPPPLRTRSSQYHFSDGNLVLQVEQTDFKVHRSVLRRRSNVFADMFKVGGNQKGSLEVGAEAEEGKTTRSKRSLERRRHVRRSSCLRIQFRLGILCFLRCTTECESCRLKKDGGAQDGELTSLPLPSVRSLFNTTPSMISTVSYLSQTRCVRHLFSRVLLRR